MNWYFLPPLPPRSKYSDRLNLVNINILMLVYVGIKTNHQTLFRNFLPAPCFSLSIQYVKLIVT